MNNIDLGHSSGERVKREKKAIKLLAMLNAIVVTVGFKLR